MKYVLGIYNPNYPYFARYSTNTLAPFIIYTPFFVGLPCSLRPLKS
ncbi:MAG: hypothetical protein J6Y82_01700 [Bacteroidales bacterium]|nr:hypothetical protein [Bacteroidales bacterium]